MMKSQDARGWSYFLYDAASPLTSERDQLKAENEKLAIMVR
jgi:hypothetical protein